MSNARFLFLIAAVLLGASLWTEWSNEQAAKYAALNPPVTTVESPVTSAGTAESPQPVGSSTATLENASAPAATVPSGEVPVAPVAVAATPMATAGRKIKVTTDLVDAEIDLNGGDFSQFVLKQYEKGTDPNPASPVVLFDTTPTHWYRAQSGWASAGNALSHETAVYQSASESYALEAETLDVVLSTTVGELAVRKTYTFTRGSYAVRVRYELENRGTAVWTGAPYRQLQRLPGAAPGGFFATNPEVFSFTGAAVYAVGQKFQKLAFDDFLDEPFNQTMRQGWSAMLQHHFVSAWVPNPQEEVVYSTAQLSAIGQLPTRYLIRQVSPVQSIAAGTTLTYDAQLFAGPKLQKQMTTLAPGLELAVDYGFFTIISKPLFWLLDFFYSLVRNWGFAIILLTIVVKLALYKLSEAQYRSMAKMRKLQPRLADLQARHRDDRQKLAMATMELYKTEKVNPIGGCLPLLLQIPVFFALYCVVLESAELRQAPFIGWITDLSRKDPYYVLPVLNVVLMWYTQKLTPMTGIDPMQQKIFQFMPVMMGVLFAFFPAGLVLYWCMQSGLGLLQQVYIMRKFAEPAKKAA